MQHCPNCGNPLPDKVSSCARCGYRLATTNGPAPQQQNKPPLAPPRNNPAVPKSPVPPAGAQMPMPANNSAPAGKQPFPPAPKTPLPVVAGMIAATETVQVQAPPRTPLPNEPGPNGPQGMARQAPPQTPMPSAGPNGPQGMARQAPIPPAAPMRTQAPGAPSPARMPGPDGQQPRVVRSSSPRPVSGNGPQGAPRTSQSRPGPNGGNNRSMMEAQPTIPVTAMRGPRNGSPGPAPAPGMYNNNVNGAYRGNQPGGSTAARLRAFPPTPPSKPAPKPVRTIGGLIWSLISPIFERALDSEPERLKEQQPRRSLLGWLPVMALTSALGLFVTAIAFNASRDNTPGAEFYYWMGVGIIYIPVVVRLIMPYSSRAERVGLLALATICLFLTKVSLSPLFYSGYDEFLHWRTINDILSTGHLFTKNPLLPVSPFYPGLEIVTSALSNISGMTSIQAGFTVVGVANLTTILSLFLLAELLSGSSRLASIAAMIYMANPHFLFFDTQFAYESLAIPLATVVMLAMTRYETLKRGRRWLLLVACVALMALDLTHHATNFVFEGLFLLWAIVYLFLRPLPLRKSIVLPMVIVGLTLTVSTVLLIGNIVISYFTSFYADINSEIAKSLGNSGGSRQLFGGGAVIQTPLWERLISLGSVGLITLAIPFLLICFWRRYRRNSLVWVFAIIITFYPVLQVLRLTTSGAELSDRASAFIFIAISFLGAVAIVQFWPVRLLNWKHSAVISTVLLVLFMGGIILGEGIPPTFMPGTYLASADSRSIDAEGIQAALWTNIYLGPNQRMYTDRVNQLLMSVYGDQYLVTKIGDNIDVTDVIFDATFGKYEISRLQAGQVHYLAIDMRLTTQLPQDGFYYEQGEPQPELNNQLVPISTTCLTKFDGVPNINRLYDSGNMVIYDTGGVINAPQIP